ncbi:hypothetical protein Pyn_01382 [Prunus yedoensis var. nudiflora]|uniref:Uncharacterized protein n=1 Tax=Prunus yedoensis var. nudiflora TaxID=2094558 RepID=A0A314UVV4_PRUYE|nr:hypothetical protein Pyn_01382 [Prunus yedoensis var. nudiflora]
MHHHLPSLMRLLNQALHLRLHLSPSPSSAPPKAAHTALEADSPPSPPSSSPVSSVEISPSPSFGLSSEAPTSVPNLAVSKKFAWSMGFTLQTWLNKHFGGEKGSTSVVVWSNCYPRNIYTGFES